MVEYGILELLRVIHSIKRTYIGIIMKLQDMVKEREPSDVGEWVQH